jgi:hypothetical protein
MTPNVGITVTGTAPPARQRDGATTARINSPSAHANPGAVGCTQAVAGTEEEGEKSPTPATSVRVVSRMKAAGLMARSEAVERQLIIGSACMVNMDEAAITGESTFSQATAVARTPRPVEIAAGANTALGRMGEPGIIDARTTGQVHVVIPD